MPSETTNLPATTATRVLRDAPVAMPRDVADYVVSIGGTDRSVLFPTHGCVSGAAFQTFVSNADANGTEEDDIVWRCSYGLLAKYVELPLREAWASAFDAWKALPTRDSWIRVLYAQRAIMAAAIASAQRTRMRNAPLVTLNVESSEERQRRLTVLYVSAFALLLGGAVLYSRRKSSGISGLRRRRRNRHPR